MLALKKIVVGVDFNPASLRALDHAIELAERLGARVLAVHALETPPILFPEDMPTDSSLQKRVATAEAALRDVLADRTDRGVLLEPTVRVGKAWQQIEAVADESGADLIVLGAASDGHGLLRTLLGDNVTTTVVRTARKPVLTIRGPEEVST
jgi:nucleotide-binding universal stress UspA family protein